MPQDHFGRRLRQALAEAGMSPDELSRATRRAISARTVFRWLAGESEPSVTALKIVCPILGASADWLIGLKTQQHDDQIAA